MPKNHTKSIFSGYLATTFYSFEDTCQTFGQQHYHLKKMLFKHHLQQTGDIGTIFGEICWVGGVWGGTQGEIVILNHELCHKMVEDDGKLLPMDRTCDGKPLNRHWPLWVTDFSHFVISPMFWSIWNTTNTCYTTRNTLESGLLCTGNVKRWEPGNDNVICHMPNA